MKKLILLSLLFVCVTFSLRAQTEIKVNPIALLFVGIGVGVEYGVSDEFGIDLNALIVEGGGGVWVAGKYYLNPRQGLDRFHIGIFAGTVTDLDPGLGFMIGQKIVSNSNRVLFDIGLGIGRSFDGGVLPYGRLSIGYRIGGG
jgi:hypothetical protein